MDLETVSSLIRELKDDDPRYWQLAKVQHLGLVCIVGYRQRTGLGLVFDGLQFLGVVAHHSAFPESSAAAAVSEAAAADAAKDTKATAAPAAKSSRAKA